MTDHEQDCCIYRQRRKDGNTDLLAKAFAEEAGKHHEVELISASASTCIDSRKEKKGTGVNPVPLSGV